MRKENFTIGSFAHVYNRGNRKQEIVRDQKDKWHFLEMLYYLNNDFLTLNPFRQIQDMFRPGLNKPSVPGLNKPFVWPLNWPPRDRLVKIIAFALLGNHFHLLLKELREGGIATFMHRFGTGMATHFNAKYQESGRLFQGPYKAKIIEEDLYLKYLSVYIQVKNVFEIYPGGYEKAITEFDKAYDWAVKYPYCSLGDYAGSRNSPIIDKDILGEMFPGPEEYKEFARQCLTKINLKEKLGKLTLEI